MGFKITIQGDYSKTNRFLNKLKSFQIRKVLDKYGQKGVDALASATPVKTGLTSRSWTYAIESNGETHTIYWTNTNENRGVNIALILQYGHGTGRGGYVSGRDYINPAIQPIFDAIVEEAWKELSSL